MRTENVLAVGVCRSRNITGLVCMYRSIQGKLGGPFPGHYRVWWVPGRDDGSILYGPVEFANKFIKIKEYKHDAPVAEEVPGRAVGPGDGLVMGEEVGPGVSEVRRKDR